MNKKLIAMAVAGALALPLAANADVTLEGEFHVSAGVYDDGDNSDFTLNNHQSEIAISGSHEIQPGLQGIFQAATNVPVTGEGGTDGFFGSRDTYIGLKGNFGTVRWGIIDTAFEDADDELKNYGIGPGFAIDPRPDGISDWKAIMHAAPGINGAGQGYSDDVFDVRAADTIEYASPNLNGFAFRVAYHGESREAEANDAALDIGQDNNDFSGWSASATYGIGNFGVTYAFEQQNYDNQGGRDIAGEDGEVLDNTAFDSPTVHNIMLFYGNDAGLRLAAAYETYDLDASDADTGADLNLERDAWYLMAAQEFGPNLAYAKFAQADDLDGVDDSGATFWALGIQRDITDQFQVYAEYAQVDNDSNATYAFDSGGTGAHVAAPGEDNTGFAIGTIYAF